MSDINDIIHIGHASRCVDILCPVCGRASATVVHTVNSGPWERHFVQCGSCDQRLVAAWFNTHQASAEDPAPAHVSAA